MKDATLYNTLAAIACARSMDEALEALEMAEQLTALAFTATQCAIAGLVLDSAKRRVDAYIMEVE